MRRRSLDRAPLTTLRFRYVTAACGSRNRPQCRYRRLEGVLDHVLGGLPVVDQQHRQAHQAPVVQVEESRHRGAPRRPGTQGARTCAARLIPHPSERGISKDRTHGPVTG